MSFFETIISTDLLLFFLVDLVIAITLLSLMRFVTGAVDNINTTAELSQRDNFAFGISLAGSTLALGIVLTGAITGEKANTLFVEMIGMALYGLIGLILIKLGHWTHDRIALNKLEKKNEIEQRNIAVAIVDASAVIATAIIIRATLIWAEGLDVLTFIAILCGFFASQAILLLMTRIREHIYARGNSGTSMQQAFKDNNIAVAVRHGGYLLGVAISVTISSNYIYYDAEHILSSLGSWVTFSLVMLVIFNLLAMVAKKLILSSVNINEEIDLQNNIGVASMDMAINFSIALLLSALLI